MPFNKSIVTLPGSFMRGRHAYGMLMMMGIKETVAANVEEYVSIAVKLADDKQWRQEMSAKILLKKHGIYRDSASMAGLERFLMDVSGRKSAVLGG